MPWHHANPRRASAALVSVALQLAASAAFADFEEDLARVDEALKNNPARVLRQALESCATRRAFAVRLYDQGHGVRAERNLRSCFQLLGISETGSAPIVSAPTEGELQTKARREIERALSLTPDVTRGLEIYRECAACHKPEGWALPGGGMPQIAGQHRSVVIKQLADIRAGNRDNALMAPYASAESIGGSQAIADVAAYIESLEMNVHMGKGAGTDLELGEQLYRDNCTRCHGASGEGNAADYVPRIHAQNYNYLLRQFQWIRDGKRRNADPEMTAQIQAFGERETRAVLDYVSRLMPPAEIRAPEGWSNPDFAN